MKAIHSITAIVLSAVVLTGCTADKNPDPIPLPSVDVLPSETVSGWPTPPNITRPPYTEPTKTDAPENGSTTPATTTSAAVPPAIEFAQRWGKKYPNVPEFAILKAANATCDILEANPKPSWETDPFIVGAIESGLSALDIPTTDAVEFGQDAQQNYCSSRP